MNKRIIITSWILLAVALLAWAAVGYAAYAMVQTAEARASDAKLALTKANQIALNQRVQSLAATTDGERTRLNAILGVDLVTMINTIEAAGNSAGVQSKVSDAALSGTQPVQNGEPVRGVVFSVQASGSYAQVMRAAKLYEALPLLSTVDQMEIERVQSGESKTAVWNMLVRIRVLTTSSS